MKISLKQWFVFLIFSAFSLIIWFKLAYPLYKFMDLSVERKEALFKAEDYLKALDVKTDKYLKAVVFDVDNEADRYLQKTIGAEQEERFLLEQRYELFSWVVRFFRVNEKEEYVVSISPKSGQVVSFTHIIEDVEARPEQDEVAAKLKAEEFLRTRLGLNLDDYIFHEQKSKKFDKRIDYSYVWEKKGVYIPWQKNEGVAKLLVGVVVSGNEIRSFYTNHLDVPEKFERYIASQLVFGQYLSSFSFLATIFLFICSIYILIKKRNFFYSQFCKRWYLLLAALFFLINLLGALNNIANIIFSYPTSTSLSSYLGIYFVKLAINLFFVALIFLLPGIASETIIPKVLNKTQTFFYYLKTEFKTRRVSGLIILGYLLFFMMLGLQAGLFFLGQKYLGVWKEWIRFTQFSSAYLPLFSAFVIGFSASISEELIFRAFSISLFKDYFKNVFIAIFFASFIWGLGHSNYAIFPAWFRSIEITTIGILMGLFFIKYGIIPVLIAHYLFDIFWSVAAYILGKSIPLIFWQSIFLLILPGIVALYFFICNRKEEEKDLKLMLSKEQEYNLLVLKAFIASEISGGKQKQDLRNELIKNNWDDFLVDLAFKRGEIK